MKGLIVLSRKEVRRGHVLEQVAQRKLTLQDAAPLHESSTSEKPRV